MTDRQGTMEEETPQVPEDIWRIEGSDTSDYGDGGLGDTVVRIPKVTDGPAPVSPAGVRARPARRRTGNTGTQRAVGADGHPVPPNTEVKTEAPVEAKVEAPVAPAAPAVRDPAPTQIAAAVAPTTVAPAVAPESPFAGAGPIAMQAPAAYVAPPVAAPAVNPYGPPPVVAPAPAAAVPVAVPKPKPKPSAHHRARKARLRVTKVDPWSVMKTSFLFSIAFGIMVWVSVSVVWTVIVNSGIIDAINQQIADLISSPTAQSTFRIDNYINTNKVLGITALLAVINVVISTALGTLAAFLYNLSANILGGLEITLSED